MSAEHISTGKLGEKLACIFLQQKGYRIITQNFRCKTGEIDIIAYSSKKQICFVEVKCRVGRSHGSPYEAVTYGKRKKLMSAIQFYILKNKLYGCKLKVEVISVILNPDKSINDIKHFDDFGTDLQDLI